MKKRDDQIAPESAKTKKAREKLLKHITDLESKITDKALEKKSIEIHRWIARHAPHRIVLRTKAISLFDENKNTASVSRKVQNFTQKLQFD